MVFCYRLPEFNHILILSRHGWFDGFISTMDHAIQENGSMYSLVITHSAMIDWLFLYLHCSWYLQLPPQV